jgi:hypothetical protein
MNTVLVLLAVSAATGFAVGTAFTWFAILISGAAIAMIFAAVLQTMGFGAMAGISIIVACLTVNQAAYLLGVDRRRSLIQKQAGDEPREGRNSEIAGENQQKQWAPSEFA